MPLRIGIDIGGTFTDFVVCNPANEIVKTFKLLSTPHQPDLAVVEGLNRIINDYPGCKYHIIHGSTVATNALLERKGSACAFVATHGFKDLLEIRRQNRADLYELLSVPRPSLIPRQNCFEVDERLDCLGNVIIPLETSQIDALVSDLRTTGVESIAICLLFSFLRPAHELEIAHRLRAEGYFVSASSEVLPEFREYERASTTAVNAYVSPVMDRYLTSLHNAQPGSELLVMQSNGGSLELKEARQKGVHCILSGPAGGVIGAFRVGGLHHNSLDDFEKPVKLITFDMGGTSTDVSLIDSMPRLTHEAVIDGCPIGIPVLDIHTIGAGGGSIASLDAGGALQVGPQSAGADPGPACYGKGESPTVTDANLVLGRLAADSFLGGSLPLYPERAWAVFTRLGTDLGLDPIQAALGVVALANAHMERAIRLISVERGHDPQDFMLLSFGGAGGLHAVDLARQVGIPQVLVPPIASTLSAFGMLAADIIKDYSLTVMLPGTTSLAALNDLITPQVERGRKELLAEGASPASLRLEPALDMRLAGQSYEITVPLTANFLPAFHAAHQAAYGYSQPDAPSEIVTLRLRAISVINPPRLPLLPPGKADPASTLLDYHPIASGNENSIQWISTPFYRGEALRPGNLIHGPAIVVRSDTTIYFGQNDTSEIDPFGNMLISVSPTTTVTDES